MDLGWEYFVTSFTFDSFFFFLNDRYMRVPGLYLCMTTCMHGTCGVEMRAHPLELDLQAAVSWPMWVMVTEPGLSSLQEQQALFTAELSLQPPKTDFKKQIHIWYMLKSVVLLKSRISEGDHGVGFSHLMGHFSPVNKAFCGGHLWITRHPQSSSGDNF